MTRVISAVHRITFGLAACVTLAAVPFPQRDVFKARLLSPFERQKAEQLLRNRYPCLGCHQLGGAGGKIGPALDGLRSRRSPDYVFTMISDPQHLVPGAIMPRVPMPARTRELIASYLLLGGGPARPATDVAPRAPAGATPADGASLYGKYCGPCHGPQGKGDGPNASSLAVRPTAHASADAMSKRSDDALFDTIFAGGYIMNRSNLMPPFGETLSREQIWLLVRQIRTLCRCQGPEWATDQQAR